MARKLKNLLTNYQLQNKITERQQKQVQRTEKLKIKQKAALTRQSISRANKSAWLPFSIDLDKFTEESTLLVGEGDFSFALSLVEMFPNLPVIATSLDSREEVELKYDSARDILQRLESLDVPILHGIDCTKLNSHIKKSQILQIPISMAAFMFPHIGNSISDQDRNIRQHQILLNKFFGECASAKISKVVITLFDGEPYNSWQPKFLARSHGYTLDRSGRFPWESFTHYSHQLTNKGSSRTNKNQHLREARIYLWTLDSDKPTETKAFKEKSKNKKSQQDFTESDDD